MPLISLPSMYNLPLPKATGQQRQGMGGGGDDKKRLQARCAVECIDLPADALTSYAHPTRHEKLQHRFVAVLKRPVYNPRSAYTYTPAVHHNKNNPPTVTNTPPSDSDADDSDRPRSNGNGYSTPATHGGRHSIPGPPLVVANDTEFLQPLAFHAHLLNAIYGKHTAPGGTDGGGATLMGMGRWRASSHPVLILQK